MKQKNRYLLRASVILLSMVLVSLSVTAKDKWKSDSATKRPYPVIDLTNGIPPWISDYNNVTVSKPQNKGSYVSGFDNTTHDGKIYRKTYKQSGTTVTIITVKSKK